jgi:hypothetical protein
LFAFDFETCWNFKINDFIEPYSSSYFYIDEKNNHRTGFYYGKKCHIKLLEKILQMSRNKYLILLGFNNNRFDNFFILKALVEKGLVPSVSF